MSYSKWHTENDSELVNMKFGIIADIIMDVADEATMNAIATKLRDLKAKLRTINSDKINVERSRVNFHKCWHDEDTNKPCETIEEYQSV